MADLWYPPASTHDHATSDAGPFAGGAPKGLLHTTESWDGQRYIYSAALGVYQSKGYWPHFTATIENGPFVIYQHLPINVAGKALEHPSGTGITNTDNVIQIEICWGANHAADMPKVLLDGLAQWMRWVEANHGVSRQALRFTYEQNPPVRMAWDAWNAYSGWVGHQHVPANSHNDPGPIDINYLLGTVVPGPTPASEPEMQSIEIAPDNNLHVVALPNPVNSPLYSEAYLSFCSDFSGGVIRYAIFNEDTKQWRIADNVKVGADGRGIHGLKLGKGDSVLSVKNAGPEAVAVFVEAR